MYLYYYSVKTPPWIGGVCESFMRWVVRFRGSPRGVSPFDCLRKLDPNVVCKSLVSSNPCGLTYVGANPASLRSAAPSRGRGERMRLCDVRLRLWKAAVRSPKSKVRCLLVSKAHPCMLVTTAARSRSGSRHSALWASPAFCFCAPTTGPFRRSYRRCDSGGNLRGQGFPCGGSGGRRR